MTEPGDHLLKRSLISKLCRMSRTKRLVRCNIWAFCWVCSSQCLALLQNRVFWEHCAPPQVLLRETSNPYQFPHTNLDSTPSLWIKMLPQTLRSTIVLAYSDVLGWCYVEPEVLLSIVTFVIFTSYLGNIVWNPCCRIMLMDTFSQWFGVEMVIWTDA